MGNFAGETNNKKREKRQGKRRCRNKETNSKYIWKYDNVKKKSTTSV